MPGQAMMKGYAALCNADWFGRGQGAPGRRYGGGDVRERQVRIQEQLEIRARLQRGRAPAMAPRHHPHAAIALVSVVERDPCRHEITGYQRCPVEVVLVPRHYLLRPLELVVKLIVPDPQRVGVTTKLGYA